MVCRWCASDGVLGVHGESIVLLREYGVADERGRVRASGGIALSPMPVIAAELPAWQSGLERKSRCKGLPAIQDLTSSQPYMLWTKDGGFRRRTPSWTGLKTRRWYM